MKPTENEESEAGCSGTTLDEVEHVGLVLSRGEQRLFHGLKKGIRNSGTGEWEIAFPIERPPSEDHVGMSLSVRSVLGKMHEMCHWKLID